MHPLICQLGPFPIHSYGLMLAIAVLVSSWLLAREAVKVGILADVVHDLVFWSVVWGIFGARVGFVLLNAGYYFHAPAEIVMFWQGGLAWQGGLVAGFGALVVLLHSKKIALWRFLDMAVPFIALGHAIGRIGCFLNGCCQGKMVAWGLYFPVWHERLHPTQLYMVVGQLMIFMILRLRQSRAKYEGEIVLWYFLLSSVERFFVEFFRADHVLYAGLSVPQYFCLGTFCVAAGVHLWLRSGRNKG